MSTGRVLGAGGALKHVVAVARFAVAIIAIAAIVATFADTSTRVVINPVNFFGYFTMQSNVIFILVALITAWTGGTGREQPVAWQLVRASATTYIVIVGIVYNALLSGTPGGGGVELAWANAVLHIAVPIFAAIDWILVPDRRALPWKRIWVVLPYPAAWLAVVLIRGATDGWVPYPFLSPAHGYDVVMAYCAGIFVVVLVVAALVWTASRWPRRRCLRDFPPRRPR